MGWTSSGDMRQQVQLFFASMQEAVARYRPIFEATVGQQRRARLVPVFETLEDYVERSSALVGSPNQIVEKVLRYHDRFGHTVMHLHADGAGLTPQQHRTNLELFQSEIAPVLRAEIPDPPWPGATAPAEPALASVG